MSETLQEPDRPSNVAAMKSLLMIFDMEMRKAVPVYETDAHIEAPNWTPDGAALIYNSGGLLYRFDLTERTTKQIDTGARTKLNNDHGISPDGSILAISDKTETGQSCIYLLPSSGGTPQRVTAQVPSYWHGWSPDGQTLVYTAKRDDAFDIYSIDVGGGTETRLTQDMGHCDGPDYAPDGQWIWFNSDKSGTAQLWRVRPDGTDLEQMTDDARVNWFPHPAPAGDVVVYLSYPTGTLGHPGDLDVELRVMSSEGGASSTLMSLFGGQGTINVPSWSPDSRQFAYVSYQKESR